MHRVEIRPAVLARLERKRGRIHPFAVVDPKRTAHVVVDMQAAFLAPGSAMEIPGARAIVPAVNRISRAVRAAGGLVVFLQHRVDPEALSSWSVYYDGIVGPARRKSLAELLAPGSPGYALWQEMEVEHADIAVSKSRFGAFMPCSSDLDARLRARGIDTVVVTGVATNCCCESTAREAMSLNYRTFFVADGTATDTDEEHNAALSIMLNTFADVRMADDVVALISQAAETACGP
jgi:ureidoacrylate peracid hydrolase